MSFNFIYCNFYFDSGSGSEGHQGGSILPGLIQGSQLANLRLPPDWLEVDPFLPTVLLFVFGFRCILRFARAIQILTQLWAI